MPFGLAVYHPYLCITTERWTCAAALYWDRLIRVSVAGVRLRDAESVRRLDEVLGLFEVREALELERDVSQVYIDLLCRGFEKQELWAEEIVGRLPIERASAKTFRIFHIERDMEIISTLKHLGLVREFAGGWWGTTRRLLDAYMEVCCTYVAEMAGADLLTDQFAFDGWITRIRAGWPGPGEGTGVPRLHLELPLVAPGPPGILPPETVRAFRTESAEIRHAYGEATRALLQDLDCAVSFNQVEEIVKAQSVRLRSLLKRFRAVLASVGQGAVPSWLVVSWCPRSLGEEESHTRWVAPGFAFQKTSILQGTLLNTDGLKRDLPHSWVLLLEKPLVGRTACQRLRERVGF